MNLKKVFAYAAVSLAALAFINVPVSAAVESEVVGYTTVEMEAGKWYQVVAPFLPLSGEVEAIALGELFSSGFVKGDTLMILQSESSRYTAPLYWLPEKNAWCDKPIPAIATPTDLKIGAGQAVYVRKATTSSVVFSGMVAAVEVPFGAESGNTWSQVGVVWPEPRRLNDLSWKNVDQGDTLMVLDSETASYSAPLYWVPAKNAWCDKPIAAIATPSELVLQTGQGLYINKRSAGVGTFVAQ